MVMVLAAHVAVTPASKPVGEPISVAPVVAIVIFGAIAVLIQSVGEDDGTPAVLSGVTVIVPVALTLPQPPEIGRASCRDRDSVGVPVMVMVLAAHVAVTPAGKPVGAIMPVAT